MWQRLAYVYIFAVISWFGQGAALAGAIAPKSGVAGHIGISPTCPGPQRIGQDCSASYAGARIQLLSATGAVLDSATTNGNGYFMINASAGDYQIHVDVHGLYPRCETTSVRIPKKGYAQIDIMCDSGMR
ncbi:MAG: hypothetical protein NVS3B11_01310 [Collimonas sp.]